VIKKDPAVSAAAAMLLASSAAAGAPVADTRPEPCRHEDFRAHVGVARLQDVGRFVAEITVNCAQCGVAFEFQGLQPGLDTGGATCSLDATEARIAIAPPGNTPNPGQRMAFGINRLT